MTIISGELRVSLVVIVGVGSFATPCCDSFIWLFVF